MPLVAVSADAKAAITPTPKKVPAQKSILHKTEQPGTQAAQRAEIKHVVRTESAVVESAADFTAPQGALYTTSDECG